MWLCAVAGWSVPEAGRFSSLEGLCNLPGYFLASSAVRKLGSGSSFLAGCCANGLVRLLAGAWVAASGARQFALLPLELCHGMNQAGLQALLIDAGERAQFRRAHLLVPRGRSESELPPVSKTSNGKHDDMMKQPSNRFRGRRFRAAGLLYLRGLMNKQVPSLT